jgi:hypothetical protein
MARRLSALIGLSLTATVLGQERPPVDPLAGATPKPEQKAPAGAPESGARRPGAGFFNGPDAEKARQAMQQLTPEERQHFLQRMKEFAELPPEKKKEIFERGEYFRRKMREDVDAAIKESGLNLSDEQKKKFADRYFEERKTIEEELRKQMEEFRKPKLHVLVEKLKQEFASQSSGSNSTPR